MQLELQIRGYKVPGKFSICLTVNLGTKHSHFMNQFINISPRLHPFTSFHSRTFSRCAPPCSSSPPPSLQTPRPPGLSWRGWQRMGRRMHKQWWPRKLGLRRNGGVMLAKSYDSYVCILSDIFRYCMCADMLRIAVWKEEFPRNVWSRESAVWSHYTSMYNRQRGKNNFFQNSFHSVMYVRNLFLFSDNLSSQIVPIQTVII